MENLPAQFDVQKAVRQRLRSLEQSGVQQLRHFECVDGMSGEPLTSAESPSASPSARDTSSLALADESVRNAESQNAAPSTDTSTSIAATLQQPAQSSNATEDASMPKLSKKKKIEALQILDTQVKSCTLCDELASTRTQTVFGVGNPNSRVVFFGEAPGADEDAQGEPFVGRAGKLLTKIIEACGFQREDVYILNTLKCRPPGNRNPSPDEVTNCRPFYERQLEIIQPEFIVCLGSIAATNVLQTKLSIGKLRGEIHDLNGIKVIATYHPAYLLRNPPAKKYVWDDMKMLLTAMGLPIPAKS